MTVLLAIVSALAGLFVLLSLVAAVLRPASIYANSPADRNPVEGKAVVFVESPDDPPNADGARGHLEATGPAILRETFYSRFVKRALDLLLSFFGLVLLSPVLLAISLAIVAEDPGPVLFSQKRVGKNKRFFRVHKFRSMKMDTPHDVPTHMLGNPDQFITKVGKFIRAHSLDELPQIWDIFIGNMSVIGPRPALWNQDLLTAERDKYEANAPKPGLTGWAQINGRDELEIPVKARFDGDYTAHLARGGFHAFFFDCRCFLGTVFSVARGEGVVEGGTGTLHKKEREP